MNTRQWKTFFHFLSFGDFGSWLAFGEILFIALIVVVMLFIASDGDIAACSLRFFHRLSFSWLHPRFCISPHSLYWLENISLGENSFLLLLRTSGNRKPRTLSPSPLCSWQEHVPQKMSSHCFISYSACLWCLIEFAQKRPISNSHYSIRCE